jgi:N-acetylmuramoyl-L-alanine amidase
MKILIATLTLLLSYLFAANPTFAYTVKQGDTLTKIASENNLSLQELVEANPQIQNLNLIYIGDTVNTGDQKKTEDSTVTVSSVNYDINLLPKLIRVESQGMEFEEVIPQIPTLKVDEPVTKEEETMTVSTSTIENYSEYEIDLLARLVRAEAQTEPFEGKVAVACVVLNRVENPNFPDTIKEVIYERRQFQPVSNGEINEPADLESIEAVKAALTEQRNLVPDSLFFYNPEIATSRWLDSRTTTVAIGQHVFKK